MKTKVWEFIDKENPNIGCLGLGEHLGWVPMSEAISEEDYKESKRLFVQKILKKLGMPHEGIVFEETFERLWGAEKFSEATTPKIRLDSGKIVYGFQVWWATVCPKCESDKLRQITPEEQEKEDPKGYAEHGFISIIECKNCGYRELDD